MGRCGRWACTGTLAGLVLCAGAGSGRADVVLDGSLGPSAVLQGPEVEIPAAYGTRRGANLFHSFESFRIPAGERVTFTGPADVANLIGRVTGGDVARIDGTLRSTLPQADLYLLNPAGIVFGPDATLDVPGAFHASTAERLEFADGARFAVRPSEGSSLSVAPPAAFGFLDAAPGALTVDGARLAPREGGDLSLVGRSIALSGAELSVRAGQLRLHAAGTNSRVPIVAEPQDDAPAAGGGPVTLGGGSLLQAVGGTLWVTGDAVRLEDAALLSNFAPPGEPALRLTGRSLALRRTGIEATGNATEGGGALVLDAAQSLVFDSGFAATAPANPAGRGGDLAIAAAEVTLRDAALFTNAASGRAGALRLAAGTRLELAGQQAVVGSVSQSDSAGGTASVTVAAPRVSLRDGAQIGANARSDLTNGPIRIDAGTLRLETGSRIGSETLGRAAGAAIEIVADRLRLNGESQISSSTAGENGGPAGDLRVTAGTGRFDSAGLRSVSSAPGKSGDIVYSGDSLTVTGARDGLVSASAAGGPAGAVALRVDRVHLGPGAAVQSNALGTGRAGQVTIAAKRLTTEGTLDNRAVLGSQDLGNQEAGARAVRIRADRLQLGEHTILRGQANLNRALGVRLTGDRIALARSSAIFTSATAGSSGGGDVMIEGDRITIAGSIDAGTVTTGNGGDVTLRARSVTLEDGAFVTSGTLALSAAGAGRAGVVRVEADTVDILGTGLINTSGFGAEEAGSIRVDATTLRILGGDTPVGPQGGLSAEANGATAAGRIDVVADRVEIRNGTIRTAAQNGPAGDIRVAADRIEIRERGNIGSATLGSGRGGGVTLRTGDLVIDGGPGFFAFLTGVNTDSSFFGDGQAGTVDIAAERIAVSNQASITSDTVNGAGGAVRVRADTIDVSAQGQISTSTNGPGAGGRVSITAERLRLRDPRTGVIAQARDVGPAGTLSLAVGHLEVLDGASITTEAAQAAGGAIFVDVDRLTRLNSGAIATSVFSGAGDGGNITLASPVLVLQPGSRISANAERGDGGNIQITTDGLFRFPGTAIEASSRLGIDGRIDIQGPDDSQTVEVVPLSLQFVDATALLKDPCIAALTGRSELVVAGRGGLPLAAASPPGLFLGLMPFPGGANAAPNGTGAGGRADHAGDRALLAAVPCVDAGAER